MSDPLGKKMKKIKIIAWVGGSSLVFYIGIRTGAALWVVRKLHCLIYHISDTPPHVPDPNDCNALLVRIEQLERLKWEMQQHLIEIREVRDLMKSMTS
jgi:hypothetical protein